MQILRHLKKLLVLLLLALVVLVFFLDAFIKAIIEREGTRIVKAKVELDDVSLQVSPLGLTLSRLQVTHPQAPMTNAFSAQTIKLNMAFAPLLKMKVIVENAALEGMRFNTPRTVSGAVAGLTPAVQESPWLEPLKQTIPLPAVDLPDPKVLIERANLDTLKHVAALKDRIQAKQQAWQQRVAALPNEQSIKTYRQRVAKLQQIQNPLQRLQALKEVVDIQQQIKQDLDAIKRVRTDLKRDITEMRSSMGQLQSIAKQDTARILQHTGLDLHSLQALAPLVFGQEVLRWINQGHHIYQQVLPYLEAAKADDANAQPSAMDTTDYSDGLPKFLIKTLSLSGRLPIPSAAAFQGQVTDLTHQSFIWGRPINLNLSGQVESHELITVKAVLDHVDPNKASDQIDLTIKHWPLDGLVLSADKDFPVTLVESRMSSLVQVLINGSDLRLHVNTFFDQLQLRQPDFDSKGSVQQALTRVLQQVEHFEVSVSARGTIQRPTVKVQTSLDTVVQKSVESIIKQEREKLAVKIQQEMDLLLAKQRADLNAKMQSFLNIEQKVASKIEGLSALL